MTRILEFVIDKSQIIEEQESELDGYSESSSRSSSSIESSDEAIKPEKGKIITNFDDLRNMKPGCRMPIDIPIEKDELLHSSIPPPKKYFSFLQTNKSFLSKSKITESISSNSSSGYSSTSSSPSTSLNYQDDLFIIDRDTDQMKNLCEKVIVKQNRLRKSLGSIDSEKPKTKGRNSIGVCQNRTHKTLTVLFDYETHGKQILGDKVVFSVKKGESVKVLRDYDDNFHLVAKCSDNKIGFLPKDYTVDLVEVKNKAIQNCLIVAENANYISRSQINLNSKKQTSNSHLNNRNYENSNNPLFKLTKL